MFHVKHFVFGGKSELMANTCTIGVHSFGGLAPSC